MTENEMVGWHHCVPFLQLLLRFLQQEAVQCDGHSVMHVEKCLRTHMIKISVRVLKSKYIGS